jgi:hypothetical protein
MNAFVDPIVYCLVILCHVMLCAIIDRLLHNVTREEGLLPCLTRRIRTFSARHEPRAAAAVLVEAVHVVLRMYDRSAGFGAVSPSGLGGGGTCCTAHV